MKVAWIAAFAITALWSCTDAPTAPTAAATIGSTLRAPPSARFYEGWNGEVNAMTDTSEALADSMAAENNPSYANSSETAGTASTRSRRKGGDDPGTMFYDWPCSSIQDHFEDEYIRYRNAYVSYWWSLAQYDYETAANMKWEMRDALSGMKMWRDIWVIQRCNKGWQGGF
jgi:hypothetical protein